MSSLFNRNSFLSFVTKAQGIVKATNDFQMWKLKVTDLALEVLGDSELIEDVCDSLETISHIVEQEGLRIFIKHQDKYADAFKDLGSELQELKDRKKQQPEEGRMYA